MNQLAHALLRIAQLQAQAVDRLALGQTLQDLQVLQLAPRQLLESALQRLQLPAARWLRKVNPESVPALIWNEEQGWGVLRGINATRQWVVERQHASSKQWKEEQVDSLDGLSIAKVKLAGAYDTGKSQVFRQVRKEFFSHKRPLLEAALGGVVINLVALATSLYSMQVYDRVVPTGAEQTLWVLTLGVVAANIFEMVVKFVRSSLYERVIDQVDQRLARSVFVRFLAVRLDQMPRSVGGLASQLRGYETVRGFLTALTNQLLVDAPFAFLFAFIIVGLAGWLAVIPLGFFMLSVSIGMYYRRQLETLTAQTTAAANLKTGLLVEAIEGAETIKSGQAGWRMLSRWMATTDEAREHELRMRHLTEHSQYVMALLQQLSYVLLVASGALLVSKGGLTMGGLIACSILSGRILSPVAAIPGQLVQWGHTKAALQGLDRLWALQDDHGAETPIVVQSLRGEYAIENVEAHYADNKALQIAELHIQSGQKIGVLGPVGAGKTTFLRLLSGMYKPQAGRVLLDGMDIAHISKPVLAERMGYLQQEGRLFAGSLRDNLILGLIDPGDEKILQAAGLTGLMQSVITAHPKGLQQEIFEGGTGLSGGQRQLVNLTRIFLRQPAIWLLDEPTASMDRNLELQIMSAFRQTLRPSDTLVLVTHKPDMLELVDRIIVIANHQIVLDGPKAEILVRLQGGGNQPAIQNGVAA